MSRQHMSTLALLLAARILAADASEKELYEFKGKVLTAEQTPFRGALPVIFLHGSTTPFTVKTVADPSGKFGFKNLRPGMYTLIVAVPRAGEIRQTIEVGPSFADAHGKVEATFIFERKPSSESSHAVAASQLSVPDNAIKEYERAQECLGKRDVSCAVERLKKAADLAPQFSAAWNNLGTISYQTREYKQAEEYFRKALEHDPDSYPPLVNLGGALLSQGKTKESLTFNLLAVKTRPDDALAHSQLGQNYFFLGQLDEAERHLKQAKALDARHFSFPQLVLAEIYGRKGDLVSAARELEEFLRYHPDSQLAGEITKALENTRNRIRDTASPKPESQN